ncbi:hypothetical protein BDN70DRAFT_939275 [Pholiota conissans]|uniref:Uncharacterized protein n=1 Tax=Pholiota conissans TaxID=109636 RepID=A0A9P5YKJ9_9AGAR|nr:hypothetical protein BDN70DRAFT_939275 [Pholiota conissans]
MSDSNTTALHQAVLDLGFTTNDEKSIIATNLNASMFLALLMGIYTVIFGGTIYAYVTRGVSNRYLVPVTVTILYVCNLASFGVQWFLTKWQFVNNGDNIDTVFLATLDANAKIATASDILNAIGLVLSDCLLIWRCFNLWDRSARIVYIPLLLTGTEGAEAVAFAVVPRTAISLESRFNKVYAAGIVIASCNTIITTALITYRIYSFLRNQHITTKKFRHIIDIVIQSGAVYSLSMLVMAISIIVEINTETETVKLFNFIWWTNSLAFPLAGLSTTIMVARVATLTDITNPPTSVHLTGIQFQPHSTTRTGTDTVDQERLDHRPRDDGESSNEIKGRFR